MRPHRRGWTPSADSGCGCGTLGRAEPTSHPIFISQLKESRDDLPGPPSPQPDPGLLLCPPPAPPPQQAEGGRVKHSAHVRFAPDTRTHADGPAQPRARARPCRPLLPAALLPTWRFSRILFSWKLLAKATTPRCSWYRSATWAGVRPCLSAMVLSTGSCRRTGRFLLTLAGGRDAVCLRLHVHSRGGRRPRLGVGVLIPSTLPYYSPAVSRSGFASSGKRKDKRQAERETQVPLHFETFLRNSVKDRIKRQHCCLN